MAVHYEGEDLFRVRVVQVPSALDLACLVYCRILTPDGDVYDEEVSGADVDGVQCVILKASGATPDSVRGRFYQFLVDCHPNDDELFAGLRKCIGERQAAGLPVDQAVKYLDHGGCWWTSQLDGDDSGVRQ